MASLRLLAGLATALLAACATAPSTSPSHAPASIALLYEQPAERAFVNGMRFYEEGRYERAEASFRSALAEGLKSSNDVAMANKHLAFIACAYNRPSECEAAFRAAFVADPDFKLSDAEVGHPIWGPVYRRVAAEQTTRASARQ